jgi:hypothetical protein
MEYKGGGERDKIRPTANLLHNIVETGLMPVSACLK